MENYFRRSKPLLGTFVEIGVHPLSDLSHERAVASAFATLETLHQLLSFHDPKSDLTKLNCSQGRWIQLHPWSVLVLRLARQMTFASKHVFNCTVGKKVVRAGALPQPEKNESTLAVGTAHDLEIRGRKVRLKRPVWITLDGIAKGFAVDLAVKEIQKQKIPGGWVNAGGDLRVFGSVTLPISKRNPDGKIVFVTNIKNSALATSVVFESGCNESFPGLIVSTTNTPATAGAWTVKAKSAWRADALTKVAALTDASIRTKTIADLGGEWLQLQVEEQL